MQKRAKEELARARLIRLLDFLANGTVVVEGKHDIEALRELGVEAVAYGAVECGRITPDPEKTVYIAMDMDKGGEQKASRLVSRLLSVRKNYTINLDLPRSMLKMLNAKSVEQICGPARELIEVV